MFLNTWFTFAPVIVAMWGTKMCFDKFYTEEPYLLPVLCIISGLLTLLASLPFLPHRRMLFAAFGIFTAIACMYNFVFAIGAVLISFPLALFLPFCRIKQRLLFLEDNSFFVIRYKSCTKKRGYLKNVIRVMYTAIIALSLLTLVFSAPGRLWGIRAFPVRLSGNEEYVTHAVPSGRVTLSIAYDNSAIYVDGFSPIETENGSKPSPAEGAGMKKGDVIVKINGQRAKESDFILKGPDKKAATFEIIRLTDEGTTETVFLEITPLYSIPDEKYMIGIYYYGASLPGLYNTVQTVSFSQPGTGHFAATAHATELPEGDYLQLLTLAEDISRDEDGLTANAGEKVGEIVFSNRYGSFGVWNKAEGEAMPIAKKIELRLGKATLLSDFEGDGVKEYEAYVTGTYRIDNRDVICLKITDERLLAQGGITRGMSGSPIIQNGRIIGAVSNTDGKGYRSYGTFAQDMARELFLAEDILNNAREVQK